MYWDSDRTLEVFRGTFGGTYHHPEPSIGIWSLDAARGTTMETKSELLSARMMTNLKWKREHGRSCPKRSTNWASPPGDGSFLRIQASAQADQGGVVTSGPLRHWTFGWNPNLETAKKHVHLFSFGLSDMSIRSSLQQNMGALSTLFLKSSSQESVCHGLSIVWKGEKLVGGYLWVFLVNIQYNKGSDPTYIGRILISLFKSFQPLLGVADSIDLYSYYSFHLDVWAQAGARESRIWFISSLRATVASGKRTINSWGLRQGHGRYQHITTFG